MVHATQVPASQTPLPARCEQSGSSSHWAHWLSSPHLAAESLVQSVLLRHATHWSASQKLPLGWVEQSV
jgi:hypothetical protein